jgi:hypothetical protein
MTKSSRLFFRADNSIVLNLDVKGTGRKQIESLQNMGLTGYNLEIVNDFDIPLLYANADIISKEISLYRRVLKIDILKVDNGAVGTKAYQVRIHSNIITHAKDGFKEAVLAAAAASIISANPDKNFIVKTTAIERFENLTDIPASLAERTVFLTEKPKKTTDNKLSRFRIQRQVLEFLTKALGADLSFEILPFADYEEREDIIPQTQNPEHIQSTLSAA